MKLRMMIKDINIRTLVSGDKQGRIVLESLYETDIEKLKELVGVMELDVNFEIE